MLVILLKLLALIAAGAALAFGWGIGNALWAAAPEGRRPVLALIVLGLVLVVLLLSRTPLPWS